MRIQFHNQTIGKIGGLVLWFEVLGVPRNNIPFHAGISKSKAPGNKPPSNPLADTSKVRTTMIRNIFHKELHKSKLSKIEIECV